MRLERDNLSVLELPSKIQYIRERIRKTLSVVTAKFEGFIGFILRSAGIKVNWSSAEYKEKNLVHAAAIGSKLAAEIYGMNVLAHDIETEQHNYTRFLFLANEDYYVDNPDKTSIVIKVRDEPGSLYRCLKAFFNESINLSKLESRQLVGSFDYYFYIDFKKAIDKVPGAKNKFENLSYTHAKNILTGYPKLKNGKHVNAGY